MLKKKKSFRSQHLDPFHSKMEVITDFLPLGFKITLDDKCSHEIRGQLVHDSVVMTILDSVLKSREITLPTKVLIGQGYGLPGTSAAAGAQAWVAAMVHKPVHKHGREELPHAIGQGRWPGGTTAGPRSSGCTFKVRRGGGEEITPCPR